MANKKPARKGGARKPAPKQLTERQIDQFNADKMRADAVASTQSDKMSALRAQAADNIARIEANAKALDDFREKLAASVESSKAHSASVSQLARQTVEEQFETEARALPAPPPPSPKSKWWRQYQDTETGEFIGWRKVLTKTKDQVISRLRLRKPAR